MNREELEGRWSQLKGKARERWAELNDDDLEKIKGRGEQLAGAIQEKYGVSKEEADRQIDEFCATC